MGEMLRRRDKRSAFETVGEEDHKMSKGFTEAQQRATRDFNTPPPPTTAPRQQIEEQVRAHSTAVMSAV